MAAETSFSRKLIAPILAVVGPAAVMTAGIMGAGSTVSLITAGCYFKYSLLWTVLISLPVIVVCQDTAARIGAMAGGKGMMRIMAEQTHPVLMWIVVAPLLFTCLTANIGQLGAMSAAVGGILNTLTGSELIAAQPPMALSYALFVGSALASLLINATGGYKRTERILSFLLFVVLVSFAVVASKAFFRAGEIGEMLGGLIPRIPEDATAPGGAVRKGFVSFSAIFGGGVAATAILSFPYFTTEGGYTLANIRAQFRKHVLLLGVLFGVYSCVLLIAGGFALHGLEGSAGFEGAGQLGRALSVLGPAGPILFSVGLLICAYTTLVVVAQLGAYFILDCLGRIWRFEKGNRLFLIFYTALILIPALVGPVWKYPEILKVVISMVVNSFVAPFAIILITVLINKRSLAGELAASPARNLFLAYSLAAAGLTCFVSAQGFYRYVMGG